MGVSKVPKLVVGLGNPGRQYADTRHNIGWAMLDAFAEKHQVVLDRSGHHGLYGEFRWPPTGEKVVLLKPLTYMNLSGRSVVSIANFYKVAASDILVLFDDLDLPVGKLRVRSIGSSGGQNGMKSVIEELGTQEIARLKFGVGRPDPGWEVVSWLLAPLSADDAAIAALSLPKAVEGIESFLTDGIIKAMRLINP